MSIVNVQLEARVKDNEGNEVPAQRGVAFQRVGPLVRGALFSSVPEEGTATAPVAGNILVDTGASVTCFDADAADMAGLAVVGAGRLTSATHEGESVPLYSGILRIDGMVEIRLNKAFGVRLQSQGLIGILGRDALATCIFIVNGPSDSFTLSR